MIADILNRLSSKEKVQLHAFHEIQKKYKESISEATTVKLLNFLVTHPTNEEAVVFVEDEIIFPDAAETLGIQSFAFSQ